HDNHYVSFQVACFNAAFDDMFQAYLNKYGSSASNIHSMHQEAGSSTHGSNSSMQMFNLLRSENRKRAQGNTPSSELRRYLASNFLSQMTIVLGIKCTRHSHCQLWSFHCQKKFPPLVKKVPPDEEKRCHCCEVCTATKVKK
nr:hypothetical protein [Tanacetum cinerariifolium]